MKNSNLKKMPLEEVSEKKKDRKAMVIFILVLIVTFVIIWFGREFLASKSMISTSVVTINGKERVVLFSQKTSGYTNQERREDPDSEGPAHYGYFLELQEKNSNKSLDEIKFKSPVWQIDRKPELIIYPNGIIWVVSLTDNYDKESPGFILKFSIKDNKIRSENFEIEDKYCVRDIQGNKVMLSEGTKNFSTIYPEALYLDLETSQIVDERKK